MADEASRRIDAALKLCHLLREALMENGDRYTGSLVPNITSITDVLGASWPLIESSLPQIDERFKASMARHGILLPVEN